MSEVDFSVTVLIVACIAWLWVVVRLVLDFQGRKSLGPGGRWILVGALFSVGAGIVMELANALGWPHSPLLVDVTGLAVAGGLAVLIVGTVARFRSRLTVKKSQM